MAKAMATKHQQVQKSSKHVDDSSDTDETVSSSQEDSSSEDAGGSARLPLPNAPEQQSESTSDGDDSSSSSSTTRSTERKRKGKTASFSSEPKNKKLKTNGSMVKASTIKPPPGYDTIKLDASDFVSETASMFTNLDGKQIWHITAPISVPVTSIATFDVQAALRGEPILHHKGVDYSMFAATSKTEALLLPKGSESEYSKVKVNISRNFHLREMPQNKPLEPLTSKNTHGDSNSVTSENVQFFAKESGVRKAPRQQPVGLLMRYQPYGRTTNISKSYRLLNPDSKEDRVDDVSTVSKFAMPSGDYHTSDALKVRTPKKGKHSRHSRVNGTSKADSPSESGPMAIDTFTNRTVLNTPNMKVRKSSQQPDSEKKSKKRKDRKEKI